MQRFEETELIEWLTVRLALNVTYFPIFRQARPDVLQGIKWSGRVGRNIGKYITVNPNRTIGFCKFSYCKKLGRIVY